MRSLTLSVDKHQESTTTSRFALSRTQLLWAVAAVSFLSLLYLKLYIALFAIIGIGVVANLCYQIYSLIRSFNFDIDEFNTILEEIIQDVEM